MTVERYNTPNHPRWQSRAKDAPTPAENGPRYARNAARSDGDRAEGPSVSGPPLLVSRDATGDDSTIAVRRGSERVSITTELPDRSLDDVCVTVYGMSVRIEVELGDTESPRSVLDRTVTLPEPVDVGGVVTAYEDPTLSVIIPVER